MYSKTFSRYGILFVVSAPSGAGKSTLCAALRQTPDFVYSVSCTTRPARAGEIHGEDYLFLTEAEFLARTEGSAIRRIGYECWLRNIAVALGNAPTTDEVLRALQSRRDNASAMVREHVQWALEQHEGVRL